MAKKTLSNEFMQKISIDEAWKELSESFNWSENLLEKYQDKVDWQNISKNSNILWTIPMIQKFKNRIDWDLFSQYAERENLTEAVIDAFKDKWNWKELSSNMSWEFSYYLLDKYADKWCWEEIINNHCDIFFEKGIDFYERYKEHIPASKIQRSRLWDGIVEQQKKMLAEEMMG